MLNFLKNTLIYIALIYTTIYLELNVITPIKVIGDSMEPNISDGDIMIIDRCNTHVEDIKRFDIVVIKYQEKYIIKRIIGLPGEKIRYKENKLYINDTLIKEPFLNDQTITEDFYLKNTNIPNNQYLVLGDNREISLDSRSIGLIDSEKIIGKTIWKIG